MKEAVGLLAEKGAKARPLAGGTDLLIHLRNKVFELDRVVDIKKIPELNELTISADGLTLGAGVPCYLVYGHADIKKTYPGLWDSVFLIGGIQIQGRASMGGNLANAAPSGDTIPAAIVYGGVCVIHGPGGVREVPTEDFCTGPRKTVLKDGELLVSIKFPKPKPNSGAQYQRFIPRNEMDIAVAGVGAAVVLSNGAIESARIALASVGPTPILAKQAGDLLAGKEPSESVIEQAAEAAVEACTPIDDMRGTIAHRKQLVRVLTRRTLNEAITRAKGA